MTGRRDTSHLDAWRKSPQFRAIAREASKKAMAAYRRMPRCGARAKTTGSPCRQPALANGRCHFHGGRTPKGKDWHTRQVPQPGPNALARLERKESHFKRRDQQKRKRLTTMSEKQRAEYERWQRTHRPGNSEPRERARQNREAAVWLADLMKEDEDDDT